MRLIKRDKIDIEKLAVMSIVFNGFQILSALMIVLMVSFDASMLEYVTAKMLTMLSLAIVVLGAALDIREAFAAIRASRRADMLAFSIGNLENLNTDMRKQRHDFMNHLQVIYSLIEMDENKEALAYIDNLHKDLARIGKVLKTAHPAVNALLAAKHNDAAELGISFLADVRSNLQNVPVPAWEICRAVGNLIDNAFDALSQTKGAILQVAFEEDNQKYLLSVRNNGPRIPDDVLARIFEAGYSTKGENRGMGLSIVSDIAAEGGGGLYVESDDQNTVFTIELPKKEKPA